MPGFDGTGPLGTGPMTGRGGGYCMSYVGPDLRFDRGFYWSGGRGWRRWHQTIGLPRWARWAPGAAPAAPVYAPPISGEQELHFLKSEAEYLEKALEQIKTRIKELENKD